MDLWWISIAAGITDALNPCVFAIAAVFLLIQTALEDKGLFVKVLFLISVVVSVFVLNIGVGLVLFSQDSVIIILKIIDALLAGLFIHWGYQSIIQWRAWQRSQLIKPLTGQLVIGYLLKKKAFGWLIAIVLAVLVGILSVQWTPNNYFTILASPAVLPGRTNVVLLFIGMYSVVVLWPVWFLLAIVNQSTLPLRFKPLITAGVMMIASLVALLILNYSVEFLAYLS